MVQRRNLNLSIDHCGNQSLEFAILEIVGNAVDANRGLHPRCPRVEYTSPLTLVIEDRGDGLRAEDFRMGESRAVDNVTIGSFGIGLLDAVAIMLRNNVRFTVHAYNVEYSFPVKNKHVFLEQTRVDERIEGTRWTITLPHQRIQLEDIEKRFLVFRQYEPFLRTAELEVYQPAANDGCMYANGRRLEGGKALTFDYNFRGEDLTQYGREHKVSGDLYPQLTGVIQQVYRRFERTFFSELWQLNERRRYQHFRGAEKNWSDMWEVFERVRDGCARDGRGRYFWEGMLNDLDVSIPQWDQLENPCPRRPPPKTAGLRKAKKEKRKHTGVIIDSDALRGGLIDLDGRTDVPVVLVGQRGNVLPSNLKDICGHKPKWVDADDHNSALLQLCVCATAVPERHDVLVVCRAGFVDSLKRMAKESWDFQVVPTPAAAQPRLGRARPAVPKDLLECPICSEIFEDPHQCKDGHSLCLRCWITCLEGGNGGGREVCPIDNATVVKRDLRNSTHWELVPNRALNDLVEHCRRSAR